MPDPSLTGFPSPGEILPPRPTTRSPSPLGVYPRTPCPKFQSPVNANASDGGSNEVDTKYKSYMITVKAAEANHSSSSCGYLGGHRFCYFGQALWR
ncbi:hypothetical protein SCLCIDRAFT_176251 [Scleroderma citrinum Foug A]|uniref:Uncharacterized protein n=1 Tax=Scleroderma citrinum Foug A TaxID=1036808 RepID=A0A0C3AAV1_9AGAM|nr:hypothetical protein SCLCIDRAFT_176251 [Scleroderma citrinum Foug A]